MIAVLDEFFAFVTTAVENHINDRHVGHKISKQLNIFRVVVVEVTDLNFYVMKGI